MCAINGIYHYKHFDDPSGIVLKMNKVSGHRGPDHTSIYHDEDVVFGHNRLAIIDLHNNSNHNFHHQMKLHFEN